MVAHNNLIQTNYGVSVIGDQDKSWRGWACRAVAMDRHARGLRQRGEPGREVTLGEGGAERGERARGHGHESHGSLAALSSLEPLRASPFTEGC